MRHSIAISVLALLALGCTALRPFDEMRDAAGVDSGRRDGGELDAAGDGSAPSDAGIDAGECPDGVIEVGGDIEGDTTWHSECIYRLLRIISVRTAELTIEAGTRVEGMPDSALVIETSARLRASGNAAEPIVFTSGTTAFPQNGDWGGVVLLGSANGNRGTNATFADLPGSGWFYGGSSPGHDCGTLEYVRIEHAGDDVGGGADLDGLTLAACGTETTVDHVHVHSVLDDGVLVYGGLVDLRHVVITAAQEDGFDWDEGWTGSAQFVIVQMHHDHGSSDAIEGGSGRDPPRSEPALSNFTVVGNAGGARCPDGMRLGDGTAGVITNSIVMGFGVTTIDVNDSGTAMVARSGSLRVENSFFWDTGPPLFRDEGTPGDDGGFDEAMHFGPGTPTNSFADPILTDPYHRITPDFSPRAGSPVRHGIAPADIRFDMSATYAGAIEPGGTDWTAGWVRLP